MRTCVSNRDADPPIQKLLPAVDVLCIDYCAACQQKNRANRWNNLQLASAGRAVPTASAEKKCWDFVHALLELAAWLQAGEDRAIAAGSQEPSGLKNGRASPSARSRSGLASPVGMTAVSRAAGARGGLSSELGLGFGFGFRAQVLNAK